MDGVAGHTHLRIDAETKELLRQRAEERGISMAALLRELLSGPTSEKTVEDREREELDLWWESKVSAR